MSLIEGFAVQKWIRDRGRTKDTAVVAANKGGDDRRDDLQLIFNHLDTARRGKISLSAIRGALSMVELSEDPIRHAHLSESIVSCFCASDHPKSAGGAVDFTQFADVMACQEQGRKFQTLQDELRSEGLAAAKGHFANIFRKEVVVRGLLDAGGTAGLMCSVFQMLFKAEGLAASSSNRARKLRLVEEAIEVRKARRLERQRAAQAKKKLVERANLTKNSRLSAKAPACLDVITSKLPIARVDEVPNVSGVSEEEAETRQPKKESDGASPIARRCLHGRKGQPTSQQQNANSRAEANIRLKKEAIRQASEVLGVRYVPPSPPSATNTAARIVNTLRGRSWWLGGGGSSSNTIINTNTSGSVGRGAAFTKHDRCRGQIAVGATPGGFVRYPPASVRRLRLRPQHPSPVVGTARAKCGMLSSGGIVAGDPDDPDNKGIKAFGVTSRRKDAIMKRTPLCGRSANARLPSWASCDNSACDPGISGTIERENNVGGRKRYESPVSWDTGAANAGVPEQEAPAAKCPVEGGWERHDSGRGPPKTASLSVSTLSNSATTTATNIITAIVPTAASVEHGEFPTQGTEVGSRISSYSSLATVPGTAAKSEAEAPLNPNLGHGKTQRAPTRPINPTRKTRSGSRPHANRSVRGGGAGGKSAGAATAEKWRRLYQNPWRTPLLVRCMRRPEPTAA